MSETNIFILHNNNNAEKILSNKQKKNCVVNNQVTSTFSKF